MTNKPSIQKLLEIKSLVNDATIECDNSPINQLKENTFNTFCFYFSLKKFQSYILILALFCILFLYIVPVFLFWDYEYFDALKAASIISGFLSFCSVAMVVSFSQKLHKKHDSLQKDHEKKEMKKNQLSNEYFEQLIKLDSSIYANFSIEDFHQLSKEELSVLKDYKSMILDNEHGELFKLFSKKHHNNVLFNL